MTQRVQRKPTTIREFAEEIGVSKTTVSRAFTGNGRIAPATREAILRSAEERGFTLNPHAQRLANGHGKDLVGLFCPGVTSGAATRKSIRIQHLLDAQGFDVPLYASGPLRGDDTRGQVESLRRLCRQRPSAILCSTLQLADSTVEELRAYQAEGGHVICFDAPIHLETDAVLFDRADNTYQVTRHLLEMGHRAVGIYTVGSLRNPERYVAPRLEGFRRALSEYGLEERRDWMFDGTDSEECGAGLAERFLTLRERPTAMYIGNEHVASAFINVLARAGVRVPRDVSVVSHDDEPVARYAAVPITTVTHPVEEVAQQVAALLSRRLDNPSAPARCVEVRGHLVPRESAAPPQPGPSSP